MNLIGKISELIKCGIQVGRFLDDSGPQNALKNMLDISRG